MSKEQIFELESKNHAGAGDVDLMKQFKTNNNNKNKKNAFLHNTS